MHFFEEKNKELYIFLDEVFHLKKCNTWDEVAFQITKEKISKTYKFFSKLFPRNHNYFEELNESNNFRTLHYGNLKGNSIINEIVRFSLYSDEIIVFHPLQNPSITNQKISPIKNPLYWKDDFLSALYFYIILKKWVEIGIVKLIVNPIDYDFQLYDKLLAQAKTRVSKFMKGSSVKNEDILETNDELAASFTNEYGNKSLNSLKTMLLNLQNPTFTEDEAEVFAKRIKDAYPKRNPLYSKLRIPIGTSLLTSKQGANVEGITYLNRILGGNIYTSKKSNWEMLQSLSVNDFWLKANYAYSKIDLNFLNNVDTSFVLNLRKEDRLSGLRQDFKKIFGELEKIDINNITDIKLNELNEEFIDVLKRSEADWKLIKQEAENARKYWFSVSVGLPIIQHTISAIPLVLGSAAWLAKSIVQEKNKLKHFNIKNPLSVYVNLKNKDEGFFSTLKNCIL